MKVLKISDKKNKYNISLAVVSSIVLLSGCHRGESSENSYGNGGVTKLPIIKQHPLDPDPAQPTTDAPSNSPVQAQLPHIATKNNLYVSPSGSDSDDGSEQHPFQTIQKAADVAAPSTTVHVLPGVYDSGVLVKNSGKADEPIYFEGVIGWQAHITKGKNGTMFDMRGDYVYVDGFDFDGSKDPTTTVAVYLGGNYNVARNNKVHDIATQTACSSKGGAGIKTDNYFGGLHNDVLSNIVYNIGDAGCKFVQGIYLSTPGQVVNNLVYKASGAGISSWHNATNLTITHNTVFNNDFGITLGSGDYYNGNTQPNDNSIVANNIVYNNITMGIDEEGRVGTNNQIVNNVLFSNGTNIKPVNAKNENNIIAEPEFIDYKSDGSGDYRLKSSSPAIAAGLVKYMPQFDLVGTVRSKADVGAYAYGAAKLGEAPPFTAGANVSGVATTPTSTDKAIEESNKGANNPTNNQTNNQSEAPQPITGNSQSGTSQTNYDIPNSPNTLYVSTSGSDSNAGTATAPFKTISRASQNAKPDTTVIILPGEYRENVKTNSSGTSNAKINYVSETKWGAKIIGSGTESTWDNKGNYVNIIGFDVSGTGRLGILNEGSYTSISNNHVHDLLASGGCNGSGGAGINNANYSASDGDIIGNVVHDIGTQYIGNCNTIQGIYSSNLRGRIMNNVVYRAAVFGIHLWHAANNVTITNNTVFNNGSNKNGGGIIIGTGDSPGGVIIDNTNVMNNIVYNNPYDSIREYCSGNSCIGPNNVIANNIVYANGRDVEMLVGKDINTMKVDPEFISVGDYHLKSTSPAINKGQTTFSTEKDIDGRPRIQNGIIDIGAYEAG